MLASSIRVTSNTYIPTRVACAALESKTICESTVYKHATEDTFEMAELVDAAGVDAGTQDVLDVAQVAAETQDVIAKAEDALEISWVRVGKGKWIPLEPPDVLDATEVAAETKDVMAKAEDALEISWVRVGKGKWMPLQPPA